MDLIVTIFIYIISVTLLGYLILYSYDKISSYLNRDKRTPDKILRDQKIHIEQLTNPKFDEIEKFYSFLIPEKLKQVYKDKKLITSNGITYKSKDTEDYIESFIPMNLKAVQEYELEEVIPFAEDGCGNYYCIRIDEKEDHIYFWDHDGFCTDQEESCFEKTELTITEFFDRKQETETA